MAVLVGLLLVVFCIGVALYPFLKARSSSQASNSSSVRDIIDRRRAIYADLDTLELERGLGNVDEVEYEERSREYRLAAAASFRDQEMLEETDAEVEEAISRELARWKAANVNGESPAVCPACEQPLANHVAVPNHEAVTDDGEDRCPDCGQPAHSRQLEGA